APDAAVSPVPEEPRLPEPTPEERVLGDIRLVEEAVEDGDCRAHEQLRARVVAGIAALPAASRTEVESAWRLPSLAPCSKRTVLDERKVYAMPARGSVAFGPADAPVTIVVGGDHGCRYCRAMKQSIAEVRARHRDDVRVVVRPLIIQLDATVAWYAACAAARQGEAAYDAMDAALYARFLPSDGAAATAPRRPADPVRCHTGDAGCPQLVELARELRLDAARFAADLRACGAEVDDAKPDWDRFGVMGAPTTFVNGRPTVGVVTGDELEATVAAELRTASERIAAGAARASYFQEAVLARGANAPEAAPPPRARDAVSQRILVRPPHGQEAYANVMSLAYRANGVPRTDAEAYAALATALTTDDAGRARLAKLDGVEVSPPARPLNRMMSVEARRLTSRLAIGEVGIVGSGGTSGRWYVVQRVPAPPPDPLESHDILARPVKVTRAKVTQILFEWSEASRKGAPHAQRTRAEVEAAVRDALRRIAGGEAFAAVAGDVSDDSNKGKTAFEVVPRAMVPTFEKLSFRLDVGEVGVVGSPYGFHIVKRVE
ncbi:MAG: peptidylprolyl isomerase, partial [Deltaproteobacteria bacterium]|nr:peptidylprolyl isomerase [Deltaproteobacteria bacterium]